MQPHSLWLGVADAQGRGSRHYQQYAARPNVEERPWFRAGLQAPYVGDVHPPSCWKASAPTKAATPTDS